MSADVKTHYCATPPAVCQSVVLTSHHHQCARAPDRILPRRLSAAQIQLPRAALTRRRGPFVVALSRSLHFRAARPAPSPPLPSRCGGASARRSSAARLAARSRVVSRATPRGESAPPRARLGARRRTVTTMGHIILVVVRGVRCSGPPPARRDPRRRLARPPRLRRRPRDDARSPPRRVPPTPLPGRSRRRPPGPAPPGGAAPRRRPRAPRPPPPPPRPAEIGRRRRRAAISTSRARSRSGRATPIASTRRSTPARRSTRARARPSASSPRTAPIARASSPRWPRRFSRRRATSRTRAWRASATTATS